MMETFLVGEKLKNGQVYGLAAAQAFRRQPGWKTQAVKMGTIACLAWSELFNPRQQI
jgi:hypothetical protein